MHGQLMGFNGVKSDHKTFIASVGKLDYKKELPSQVKKLIPSGRISDTVNYFQNTNWHLIKEEFKTNQATDLMYEAIMTAEDLDQQLRVLKIRNNQPWITQSIKQLIRKRQPLSELSTFESCLFDFYSFK